ncbi:MAG: heme exporter protein CcmD [Rhodospirillaceae bacterium]|jgi:heme exporter protein D|nr:heme exporter protein CcmD [Rhodospirillaceae bacterium]MDD9913266.1 heme exporter protein CcmD [Rhodospirillaceae bacterium]MDD9925307.1 heme exporter protein CcmD [Rhodospirillaceae bacterium]|tara:strand:- start:139 stop:330 length:192 start_codon:yes stop_codon:yes gene_type:complete
MDSVSEFFAMGGYAPYIWPAYLIAAGILVALLGLSLRDLKRNENTLKTLRAERRGGAIEEAES